MEVVHGVPIYIEPKPYEQSKKLSKDLTKRHRYALNRLSNMRREVDTFQLKKPIKDEVTDLGYSSRAFSEAKSKENFKHLYKIKTASSYVKNDENRPKSVQCQKMIEGAAILGQLNQSMQLKSRQMVGELQEKRKEQIGIRNKIQDTKHFTENTHKIQMEASKSTDMRLSYRRECESVDKQLRNEKEKIIILKDQLMHLQESTGEEISRNEEYEKLNTEMYRRILEKRKIKKEMEDELKDQEAVLKHLALKIEDLVAKEQECLGIIKRYEKDTVQNPQSTSTKTPSKKTTTKQ